ncbi:uncharacterized protein N7503_009940 [Penicillium pulvis]|uniref:uncharacterized protein n=1 Tax=Penicillium pulvis TaxID=1562058 RepID=UPI002549A9C0|nr:uncharacterized protein N7503_009940 [Penicillium pulvis]KAJ5784728.1 hypothetical protein N7503_009940 [Penicillium pulvis]
MPDISGHWKLADFVPKLQDVDDWVAWNCAFIMGITAIDPRFKEIIDGKLTAPHNHPDECSSVGFLSIDESGSPYDTTEKETAFSHAALLEDTRAFAQLSAMGSVLLRMTLGPVPAQLISETTDLKAAYQALSREFGRYDGICNDECCSDMFHWMRIKFQNYDDPCQFIRVWKAALDGLLVDHDIELDTIFDLFLKGIRDHDGVEDFLRSLQFDHSSMEMVYRQFMQHVPFSEI